METIAQYDKAAKLLVTVAAPLQAALFALYDKIAGSSSAMKPWFTDFLLILFVASLTWVFIFVVKVCDMRPSLKAKPCGTRRKSSGEGVISSLLKDAIPGKMSQAVEEWEDHIEEVADCKHKWLAYAYGGFVAGSVIAVLVLFVAALCVASA
jgi:hypothetical protein